MTGQTDARNERSGKMRKLIALVATIAVIAAATVAAAGSLAAPTHKKLTAGGCGTPSCRIQHSTAA
jgi:hypothetical protein